LAAHRLLGEIETANLNFSAAETHLTTALDLATACDVPYERALTLLVLAELRAATRASVAVATLVDDVRRIGEPLGAAPLLARAGALAARFGPSPRAETYPAGLTQREVDVLRLLAQGRTDKEIADALFISYRTVTTHVSHIFTKLDVASRGAAVAAAGRWGLV
jgi:DNA-binding NarL/FixJ family response regulator